MCLNQYMHFPDSKNSLINNTGSESIVYSVWNPGPLSFRCRLLAEEGWRRGSVCSPCALFLPTCLVLPLALRKQMYHGSSVYWGLQTPQTFSGKRGRDSLSHIYTILGILGDLGDVICRLHANRTPFCRRNISIQILVARVLPESVLHR